VSPTYHATFTGDARSVVLARTAIARFARLCGFAPDLVADVATAAGEALITAADYSRLKRGGGFSVTTTFAEGELRIEIQSSAPNPHKDNGGFGTIIMRSLMNDVTYSRGGTRVRLVKRID
jgi:anti-sigma regulatory factor (Ser/Thr protein kinase)